MILLFFRCRQATRERRGPSRRGSAIQKTGPIGASARRRGRRVGRRDIVLCQGRTSRWREQRRAHATGASQALEPCTDAAAITRCPNTARAWRPRRRRRRAGRPRRRARLRGLVRRHSAYSACRGEARRRSRAADHPGCAAGHQAVPDQIQHDRAGHRFSRVPPRWPARWRSGITSMRRIHVPRPMRAPSFCARHAGSGGMATPPRDVTMMALVGSIRSAGWRRSRAARTGRRRGSTPIHRPAGCSAAGLELGQFRSSRAQRLLVRTRRRGVGLQHAAPR